MSIQAALSPLLIVGSFCGLGFFEYPLGRPRPYLTCLYFLIAWSFYVYLFYYLIYTGYTAIHIYMLSWTNIIVIFSAILSIFVSLFRFKKLKTCLYKLSIVDDTLEVLGTSKEYRRLYRWTIRITIGWILLTFFMNICDYLWMNDEYFSISICVPFVANHMFHVNVLNGLIWGVILRHVHLELCFISRELNEIFSIPMTMQMASYFAFFVELCCEFYTTHIDKNKDTFEHFLNNFFIYVWVIVYTAKLLALNHICQIICDKTNETVAILYKLSNNNSDKDLREQILQFILQIKRREVKFYGMGLFYFGYDFIRKFYVTIATVLVIVIQMHITAGDLLPYDDVIDKN